MLQMQNLINQKTYILHLKDPTRIRADRTNSILNENNYLYIKRLVLN
jgi:hypothetical protein